MKPDFHRIQSYADSIDRLVRLMRAEVEKQVSLVEENADLTVSTAVSSGMQSFLEAGESFGPEVVEPYKEIYPGLKIGLDAESMAAHVVATGRSMTNFVADEGPGRIARLSIHPVFAKQNTPKWVTLETTVDAGALAEAIRLEFDMITHLEIASQNDIDIPQVFHVSLRVTGPDHTHRDVLRRSLPVSSVPLAQTVAFNEKQLKELALKPGEWVAMIFELPLKGAYTFHLDWYAARVQTN